MSRLLLLNALPLSFEHGALFGRHAFVVRELSAKEVKEIVAKFNEVVCCIRHATTLEVINKLLGLNFEPSNEKVAWRHKDVAIVAIASNYNRNGEEIKEPELKFYEVVYYDNLNLVGF